MMFTSVGFISCVPYQQFHIASYFDDLTLVSELRGDDARVGEQDKKNWVF